MYLLIHLQYHHISSSPFFKNQETVPPYYWLHPNMQTVLGSRGFLTGWSRFGGFIQGPRIVGPPSHQRDQKTILITSKDYGLVFWFRFYPSFSG